MVEFESRELGSVGCQKSEAVRSSLARDAEGQGLQLLQGRAPTDVALRKNEPKLNRAWDPTRFSDDKYE